MSGRGLPLLLVLALALGLGGCGRKAPNLAPEDSTYPRPYPAPEAPAAGAPDAAPAPAPTAPALERPGMRDDPRRRTGPTL